MENRASVISKVDAYVKARFDGDYKKFFDFYDKDKNGLITYNELEALLADANVGFQFTRWYVAKEIMTSLDHNGDGFIAWPEFDAVLNPANHTSFEKTPEPALANPNDPANRSFPTSGPKEALRPTEEHTLTGEDSKAIVTKVPEGSNPPPGTGIVNPPATPPATSPPGSVSTPGATLPSVPSTPKP